MGLARFKKCTEFIQVDTKGNCVDFGAGPRAQLLIDSTMRSFPYFVLCGRLEELSSLAVATTHQHTQHATPRHADGAHLVLGMYVCFGLDKQLSNRQRILVGSSVKSRKPILSHSHTLTTQHQGTQPVLTLFVECTSALAWTSSSASANEFFVAAV